MLAMRTAVAGANGCVPAAAPFDASTYAVIAAY
jgi:hypothetical protein